MRVCSGCHPWGKVDGGLGPRLRGDDGRKTSESSCPATWQSSGLLSGLEVGRARRGVVEFKTGFHWQGFVTRMAQTKMPQTHCRLLWKPEMGSQVIMPPRTSMRVAGGTARGRRLLGAIAPGARPTTERVRAAIFNILSPETYLGERALDLFAGSGSLGIEALSRGAAWADFRGTGPQAMRGYSFQPGKYRVSSGKARCTRPMQSGSWTP